MDPTSLSALPRFEVLGVPRLVGAEGELLTGRKELALLAHAACRAPRAVRRDELAELFWGERGEARARQSLRQALATLRRAVGEGLVVTPEEVGLDTGALDVDVLDFERRLAADRLAEAVGLWRGEFLTRMEDAGGDSYRVWLEAQREGLRQRLVSALERLIGAAAAGGNWEEALRWAEQWVEVCPLEERAHAALLDALVRAGRAEEARARHAAFVDRLRGEMGMEPSGELLRLLPAAARTERPVHSRLPTPGSVALFSPILAGRDGALADLDAAWQIVQAQGSAVVVVEGEAGIGKTRLCEEFLRGLASLPEPPLVLRARMGAELGGTIDASHDEALRELLSPLTTARGLAGADDAALAALARWVPGIRERFRQLPEPGAGERELRPALREVLDAVATEVPVVIFLDDVPRADPLTRRAILALARELPPAVLLLLTGRFEELQRVEVSSQIGALPAARRIILQPLEAAEVEALVGSMLELRPDTRRGLARRLHEATEGNPFFLVEMVAALADSGQLALDGTGVWCLAGGEPAPLPVSTSVRDAVVQRLGRLGEGARRLLEAAARLGRGFEILALQEAAGLPHERFVEALDELVARRLLRRQRAGSGFEFTHDLVRQIVLERLPPTQHPSPGRAGTDGTGTSNEPGAAPAAASATVVSGGGQRSRARPRPGGIAALAAVLLLMLAAGITVRSWRPAPAPVSPTSVAVLPFTVRGDAAYAYLGEGMVDLLAAQLDGAGALRSVDPRSILSAWRGGEGRQGDAYAPELARRFGAGLYVLGSVVEAGGRLQITASLYDTEGTVRGVVQTGTGDETSIFELVEEVARQLLSLHHPGRETAARLAASTSASLEALRAYLRGEVEMRGGRFGAALGEFADAVEIDSTFALAHLRYALAAEWAARPELLRVAAARAQRHGARLPRRERMFLGAYHAQVRGDAAEAEARYRELVTDYPDDRDGWFMLGETLFHLAPGAGRPLRDAEPAFHRVLALDPRHEEAILHLVRIAAIDRDRARVDSLMAQLQWILGSEGDVGVVIQAVHASVRGDQQALRAIRARLTQVNPIIGMIAVAHLALFAADLEAAFEMAGMLVAPAQPAEVRAAGHVVRAHLQLARGRWHQASAELTRAEALSPTLGANYRGLLLASPWLAVPQAELESALLRLQRGEGEERAPSARDVPNVTLHPGLEAALRLYVRGLLEARSGRHPEAERLAGELAGMTAGRPEQQELLHDLAWGVRARSALASDDLAAADGAIARIEFHVWYQYAMLSAFFARSQERYLRAELLARQGRIEEAIRAFAAFDAFVFPDVVHLAPSHLRRGELHERRGEREAAIRHYRRFLELWTDADPELQPRVREVEERVSRLRGG